MSTGTMSVIDLALWWLAFLIVTGLIPAFVIGYLLFPAKCRLKRMEYLVARLEPLVTDGTKAKLNSYRENTDQLIHNHYHPRNFILPLSFLTLVLMVGFYLLFSTAYPLFKFNALDDLLLSIPNSTFYGFFGGWFYALYSVVKRYRSADISPGLVLQLGYQVLLAGGVAYFAVTLTPDLLDSGVAFAVGFIPYDELTTWLHHTAQIRLGTTKLETAPDSGAKVIPAVDSLTTIQGLSPAHRERLGEENILTAQNLAYTNPLTLCLITNYEMPIIIDWIDQAYLRTFVNGSIIPQLAHMGIRGAVELAQVRAWLLELNSDEARQGFLKEIAQTLGRDIPGTQYLISQVAEDPQVEFLAIAWKEFGCG
ncbi:MAG: hypothetical protein KC587_05970 [Nitrospira sp.]|nr:hypothetical protein [Nitrospira sp.]MCA9456188.1 hypothetical protein [Nitrospira sp.]MCW5783534.1 hypothetical protein [Nitrospirales bacterium]